MFVLLSCFRVAGPLRADAIGRLQILVSKPDFKIGAAATLGVLFFLIFLAFKVIRSRKRRF
jgi:hypothetical protein